MLKSLATLALAAAIGSAAFAQQKSTPAPSGLTAQEFTRAAASSNMLEIESSRLAESQAQQASVKEFARQMITDHTKASKDLEAAAKKAGVQVPENMEQKHQAVLQQLRTAQGAGFDNAYIDAQSEAHREAVQLFADYSKVGDNAELKQFATQTLPTLEQHHSAVAKLKQGEGGSAGAGGAAHQPKK